MRLRFVNSIGFGGSIALMFVVGLIPARICAQSALDKTTLGQSQNDGRDYVNSLVPGEKKYGKGEKKQEVNSAELKSKAVKDTTFGGSLLNMGIVGAEPKLDESKRPSMESEKNSSTVKQPVASDRDSSSVKQSATTAVDQHGAFSNLSDTAFLAGESEQSDVAAGDKEPKATGANTSAAAGNNETQKKQTAPAEPAKDQKSSTASSEKPTKPDGDH